jgi:hypothetical protein
MPIYLQSILKLVELDYAKLLKDELFPLKKIRNYQKKEFLKYIDNKFN